MGVGIRTQVDADFTNGVGFSPFTATVNYMGTAALTSVIVTDSQSDSLSPSVLESTNGTFLTPTGYASAVPEPRSVILLLFAIPVVFFKSSAAKGRRRMNLD